MTLKSLIDEAEKLSRAEQVELLDELHRIVNVADDLKLTAAQQMDLDRRGEEFRSGQATLIPGDEAIAHLRKRS